MRWRRPRLTSRRSSSRRYWFWRSLFSWGLLRRSNSARSRGPERSCLILWRGGGAPPMLATLLFRDNPAGTTGDGNGEKSAQEGGRESGQDSESLKQEESRQKESRRQENRRQENRHREKPQGRDAQKFQAGCQTGHQACCHAKSGRRTGPAVAAEKDREEGRKRVHGDCR